MLIKSVFLKFLPAYRIWVLLFPLFMMLLNFVITKSNQNTLKSFKKCLMLLKNLKILLLRLVKMLL